MLWNPRRRPDADLFWESLTGEPSRGKAAGRGWREGPSVSPEIAANLEGEPEVATLTAVPLHAEDESEAPEDAPAAPSLVVLGSSGLELTARGTPPPGTFVWTTDDPAVARVSPTTDPSVLPSRSLVLGLSPGRTKVRYRYRPHLGSETSGEFDVVVVRSSLAGLREPAGRPASGPQELVRPVRRSGGFARRSVVVQFEPADFWAGQEVTWTFTPVLRRGSLPAGVANLEASPGFDFTPGTGRSVVGRDGRVAVRVNMPPLSLNRCTLMAIPVGRTNVAVAVTLEAPGIVVLDAGHGGSSNFPDSSANNATAVTTHVLEKDMALDMVLRARDALLSQDRLVQVHLTRDDDFNVRGAERAGLARCRGADVFLSIHFNSDGPTARGVSTFVRAVQNHNVNHDEDVALAERVQAAVVGAIPGTQDRHVQDDTASQHPTGLAVLSDTNLGNTAALHPIRACLCEVEFISNPTVDAQFNTAADRDDLRRRIANAIAGAIVDDLAHQP